ncbi:MAG: cobalamin biosynthesis protein [Sulfolobales archaeon]
MIEYLIPSNPIYRIAPILIGLIMDLLYPYHTGIMLKIHPVYTSYVMAKKLAPPGSTRLRGVATWVIVMATHLALYACALYISYLISDLLWLIIASYIVKISTPVKLLRDIVLSIARCLERGDLLCAREKTSWIVRRDTKNLGEGHIASAAIESLFESTVDGISSPLFYTALFGPLGGLAQRIINTLDSALGYKTPEYIYAGWLSARADTAISFIPARITAILIIILAPIAGGEVGRAYNIYKIYRGRTESINAGHPMSAAAGALGVRLEKIGSYSLGEGELPRYGDIYRGLRLFYSLLIAIYILSIALATLTHMILRI